MKEAENKNNAETQALLAENNPQGTANIADDRVLGAVNINHVDENMLPCPFCGGKAGIICDDENGDLSFIIVGCLEKSMLCPNPKMVIYNHDNLGYDLKYWNRRFNCA